MADDPADLIASVHDHLAATAELPVETTASRWLGEAQAVAADARGAPAPVVEKRAGQVRELLANVESTGHPEADEHLAAARELAERI